MAIKLLVYEFHDVSLKLLFFALLCFSLFQGGICKEDLKRMMKWAASTYKLPVLLEIANAHPTVSSIVSLQIM